MSLVALHRAHFDLGSGVQVEIESSVGSGRALALPLSNIALIAADEEVEHDPSGSREIPRMCLRDGGELFEPFQLREDTDYFIDVTVPLPLDQAIHRSSIHTAWPFDQRLVSAFVRDPAKRWREVQLAEGIRHTVITGQLRLRSHAGVLNLGTVLGGNLRAEVVCRKLKYFDEFKALLDGLAEKATELLLAYDSPVSLSFGFSEEQAQNDAALHFIMRYVMSAGQLPNAAEELLDNPHSQLIEHHEMRQIEDIDEGQADLIIDNIDVSVLGNGGPLARFFGGYTPQELPQRETIQSHDTPENRYTKAFLEHCLVLAQRLESRMRKRKRNAAEREAKTWVLRLDELLQHGLWGEVGPLGQIPANSQVMARKRGYKELFRLDVALRMSLNLAWAHGSSFADGLNGDVRPVNQIYEYWCFFVLREVLKSICSEKAGGNFLSVSADGLRIQLVKGRRSECRFEFVSSTGVRLDISLFYNRRFTRSRLPKTDWSGSYTAAFDPDYSIVVRAPGGAAHWLHFDAKYRLERHQAEGMFESNQEDDSDITDAGASSYHAELARVHKQDDLFKMHTYRDGILSSRGAYVLFPGDGIGGRTLDPSPNLFVRHPSALGGGSGQLIPSVGAFPLTPEDTGGQIDTIRDLLRLTIEAIGTGKPYAEEQGWYEAP